VTDRRFPPPWTVEMLPGGFKVIDANPSVAGLLLWSRFEGRCGHCQGPYPGLGKAYGKQFAKLPGLLGED
jgi:hypothetical protein